MRRNYNNIADPIALTIAATAGATVFTVSSTAGFPAAPFILGVERGGGNEEVCLVTDLDATTFTVVRGYDDTTPVPHDVGAALEHCVAAIDFREANAHVNDATLDEHTQYMRTDGTRHDLVARHVVGTSVPVAVLADLTTIAIADAPAVGNSGRAADARHRHGMPDLDALRDALAYTGEVRFFVIDPGSAWIEALGQVVASSTVPNLAPLLTNFQQGNEGAGNVRVPDLRGRSPMGSGTGTGLTARTLGQLVGAETVAITVAQLPVHNHPVTDPGHIHPPISGANNGFYAFRSDAATFGTSTDAVEKMTFSNGTTSATTGISVGNTGTGQGHANVHPCTVFRVFIKK